MTAVQILALTLLTLTLIGAAIAVVDAWFGSRIDQAVESAFDLHADEAVALTRPQPVTGLPVFDATLAGMPATQAAVKVRGDLLAVES